MFTGNRKNNIAELSGLSFKYLMGNFLYKESLTELLFYYLKQLTFLYVRIF